MRSRFADNYCIDEYYDYCDAQTEAGLIPSSFDEWLAHELSNIHDTMLEENQLVSP